jgi:hypothetical protein
MHLTWLDVHYARYLTPYVPIRKQYSLRHSVPCLFRLTRSRERNVRVDNPGYMYPFLGDPSHPPTTTDFVDKKLSFEMICVWRVNQLIYLWMRIKRDLTGTVHSIVEEVQTMSRLELFVMSMSVCMYLSWKPRWWLVNFDNLELCCVGWWRESQWIAKFTTACVLEVGTPDQYATGVLSTPVSVHARCGPTRCWPGSSTIISLMMWI